MIFATTFEIQRVLGRSALLANYRVVVWVMFVFPNDAFRQKETLVCVTTKLNPHQNTNNLYTLCTFAEYFPWTSLFYYATIEFIA